MLSLMQLVGLRRMPDRWGRKDAVSVRKRRDEEGRLDWLPCLELSNQALQPEFPKISSENLQRRTAEKEKGQKQKQKKKSVAISPRPELRVESSPSSCVLPQIGRQLKPIWTLEPISLFFFFFEIFENFSTQTHCK